MTTSDGAFDFGSNWHSFLSSITNERILIAEQHLQSVLQLGNMGLAGKTFLDVGSGSGLFSLAAYRLGGKVLSFDLNPLAVTCARELRAMYGGNADDWAIVEGDMLDASFLHSLGRFNVVYAFGSLHHTGNMWQALRDVVGCIAPKGQLYLGIYNDQGMRSRMWKLVKQTYCTGTAGKLVIESMFMPYYFVRFCIASVKLRRNQFAHYKTNRGMSAFHDWRDWLGGLPFEVASFNAVTNTVSDMGFWVAWAMPTKGAGNNQWTFVRGD